MTIYQCSECTYESSKRNVERHIQSNKCYKNNEIKLITINQRVTCDKCGKNYASVEVLGKHKRGPCRGKNLIETGTVINNVNNITNNNNNINTDNRIDNSDNSMNINIIVNLTPYNDPNMEGMKKYLEEAIRKTFLSVPTIIERVHFNTEYPENHNICIKNKRTTDAKVFDGEKWKTIDKNELMDEIINNYERELEDFAIEQEDSKYIKNYNIAKKRGDGEEDLKKHVHDVIYDNNKMINTNSNTKTKIKKKEIAQS